MQFYRALDTLPERWRPFFIVLAITGLRISELCALTPSDLDSDARLLKIRDAKTPTGWRIVVVAEDFWPYILASVPVPVTHRYLTDHWEAAVDRAGLNNVRVHDLRYFAAQFSNASTPAAHRTPKEIAEDMVEVLSVLKLDDDQRRRLLVREVR